MKTSYFDNSATTRIDPQVQEVLLKTFSRVYGNPSSPHAAGREARKVIEDSRERIAGALGVHEREIIFTSGATEANNLVFRGVGEKKGKHIITTQIEHPSVLEVCSFLEQEGWSITRLAVNETGRVHPADVQKAVTGQTVLVSVMWANNEVGTIQPVEILGKDREYLLHSDAAQALGKIPLNLKAVDYLTLSGHKLHGPKGVGALYFRKGVPLHPLILGGGQEFEKRGGTENVALIAGFAKAVSLAMDELSDNRMKMEEARRCLVTMIKTIPESDILGSESDRLPNLLNVSFKGVDAEALVLALDAEGVYISSGSACSSLSTEPSHVLLAMGLPMEKAKNSVRFSVAVDTRNEEVEHLIRVLPRTVSRLRTFSEKKVDG